MFTIERESIAGGVDDSPRGDPAVEPGRTELAQLLAASVDVGDVRSAPDRIAGAVVGTLVGFGEDAATPFVTFAQQPGTAALPARSTVDLHGVHVGRDVVIIFENADPRRPIVVGVLQAAVTTDALSGRVDVEADGQRVVVVAKDRLVLRCGRASITLTKEGKLILRGEYVSTQSSGVLRIRGGSVQIN